jgi:hypothetical protein
VCSLIGCGGADDPNETTAPVVTDTGVASEAAVDTASPPPPVHYATKVVSYTKGEKGGFNEAKLPGIVLGPPVGGGCCAGSLDVLSLGDGGEIVLGFDVAIVDEPGADFVVFENSFEPSGDPTSVVAEPAEVAVSEDGTTWTAFPCTATTYPYGSCAGWHPVYATAESPIDPRDPAKAGGDAFDLGSIGVKRARFVRIRDMNGKFPAASPTAGFDLDGVAVLHFTP